MNARTHKFVRTLLFAFLAMGLAGCHYHRGHCGSWGHHGGHHHHSWATVCLPIPRCR